VVKNFEKREDKKKNNTSLAGKMKLYLFIVWEFLKSSFWFLPLIIIFISILISIPSLRLDENLKDYPLLSYYSLWKGGAEGAQQILSSIAGALITLMSIVFSVVTIPLSLAASQYGSRLIRRFMQDPGTQLVLGFLTANTIFCILVLRAIKTEPEPFIPSFSITLSLLFTIISLGLLIYFIHHVALEIQSPEIISRVSRNLIEVIKRPLPGQIVSEEEERTYSEQAKAMTDSGAKHPIFASMTGYIQTIDYDSLLDLAEQHQCIFEIPHRSSNFIKKHSPLLFIYQDQLLDTDMEKKIKKAFILGEERIQTQDIEYSLDELVTIAVRAMTEDVRDTFTANFCIDYLGDALCRLCQKEIPSRYYRDKKGHLRLIIKQITFHGLVDSAFNQIRQFGKDTPSIIIHLLETIASIIPFTKTDRQREILKKHALMIKRVGDQFPEPEDRKDMEERFDLILKELNLPQ
jgi:uncharacterized membrane protein